MNIDTHEINQSDDIPFKWIQIIDSLMNQINDLPSPLLKSYHVELNDQVIVIQSERQFYTNVGIKLL